MIDPLSAGEDVTAGRYFCTACGYVLVVDGLAHLGPCPDCHNHHWEAQTGGEVLDDVVDPYPEV